MKLMFKRIILGSFAVIVLASSIVTILATSRPLPVQAQSATDYPSKYDTNNNGHEDSDEQPKRLGDKLCIFPSLSSDTNDTNYHVPDGWLSAKFLNRAAIQLTFNTSSKKCKNINISIDKIDSVTKSSNFIDGVLYDSNTSDDNWNYRGKGGGADDSQIAEFDKDPVANGDFDAQNIILNASDIRKFLSQENGGGGAEYILSIEESDLPNIECHWGPDNDSGDNFQLIDSNSDGADFLWRCSAGDFAGGSGGYRIKSIFTGKLEAFNITYIYDGNNKIVHVSENAKNKEFVYCGDLGNNRFYLGSCDGSIYLDVTKSQLQNDLKDGNVNSKYGDVAGEYVMKEEGNSSQERVVVAGATSDAAAGTQAGLNQVNNSDGDLTCDVQILNPLTWLFCPIVAAANQMVGQLDNAIVKELNIDTEANFGEIQNPFSNGSSFYQVWSNFRTIGLVILVIAALVMVISQAISIGPFDAYTVKKVMPRIVVAIIFMTLSWEICKFLINLTNDVSLALRTMIQAPFASVGGPVVRGQTSIAGAILSGYAALGLGIIGLLSFALTALLAVLIAFLVLTIRKMAIIFLVLMAPFAIACYILPNTKKVWDFWWDTFSKALLMFPIIMGFIAIGRVFAAVTSAADEGQTSLLAQVVILVAYFGPYFAMPIAFRLAGGAIANIAGIANDRSRGLFDRLKTGRQERVKDRFARARNEKLWNPNNALVNNKLWNANKIATWGAAPHKNLQYKARNLSIPGLSAQGRQLEASIEHSAFEQTQKLAQTLNTSVGTNDKAARVLAGLHDGLSEETRARFQEAGLTNEDGTGRALTSERDILTASKIMAESGSHTEEVASTALRRAAPVVAGLYNDAEMSYASVSGAASLVLGAHGFVNDGDIPQIGNNIATETGSTEFADSMLVQTELAVAPSMPHLKAGYGHRLDTKTGKFISGKEAGRDIDVIETFAPGTIAAAKGGAIKDQKDTFEFILKYAEPTQESKVARLSEAQSAVTTRQDQIEAPVRARIQNQSPGITASDLERQVRAETDSVIKTDAQIISARDNLAKVQTEVSAPSEGARAQQVIDRARADVATQLRTETPDLPEERIQKRATEIVKADGRYSGAMRIAQAHRIGSSFKQQQIFSAASRFSQAPVDTKAQIAAIIEADPELKREFEVFEGRAAAGDGDIMSMIQASNSGMQSTQQQSILQAQRLAQQPLLGQNPLPPQNPLGRR